MESLDEVKFGVSRAQRQVVPLRRCKYQRLCPGKAIGLPGTGPHPPPAPGAPPRTARARVSCAAHCHPQRGIDLQRGSGATIRCAPILTDSLHDVLGDPREENAWTRAHLLSQEAESHGCRCALGNCYHAQICLVGTRLPLQPDQNALHWCKTARMVPGPQGLPGE
jgi:hypothetical protein